MKGLPLIRLVPVLLVLSLVPSVSLAQTTFVVTTETQLRNAITSAVTGDTIRLQSNITLTADLPGIATGLTFDGGGFTLSGASQYRGLTVLPNPISVSVQNLTIANTVAAGGAGGSGGAGGGGGAGLGGALFIGSSATVTVSNVNIVTSSAVGGAGGSANGLPSGGGGGGLGGAGGSASGANAGGGGGFGNTAAGGTAAPGSPGIYTGGAAGGAGQFPGGATGGGGGAGIGQSGGGGEAGGAAAGGGGLGGFGGGGGGGSTTANGGGGGFGGGGGGGSSGGWGSYGGGGGGGMGGPGGFGGTFGGAGSTGGGGGAALGGAIFVDGSLLVSGPLNINGSSVTAGTGASGGSAGQAYGSAIFLSGSGSLFFDIAAGAVSTIADDIVDEFGTGLGDAGSWSIDKQGGGTLILSGNNRYAGGTFITGGTLQVASANSLGLGPVFLGFDSTLALAGGGNFAQSLLIASSSLVNVTAGVGATWSGTINDDDDLPGGGRLSVSGGGLLELTNNTNRYSLGTVVTGGSTVRVSDDGALGAAGTSIALGNDSSTGGLSIAAGANFTSNRPITLGGAGGIIDAQAGASGILSGAITGTGALTKTGAGTVVLNGANAYSGATSVDAGVLRMGAAGILATGAGLSVTTGATLDLNGFSQTVGSVSGAGAITLGSATLTTGGSGASSAFTGVISGSGALVKTGSGILTLTGPNTYSGGTLVSQGILLGNSVSLQGNIVNNALVAFDETGTGTYAGVMSGTGGLVKNGAGTLVLSGANSYSGGTTVLAGTLAGTTASLTGNILNNATVTFDQGAAGSYLGTISGAGIVTKSGGGTVVFGQANSHTGGTNVLGGVLQAGATGAFGTGSLFVANGASVNLAGFGQSVAALSGEGGLSLGSATLEVGSGSSSGSFGGVISGSGSLVKTGAGVLTLTGANTYTGGTTVAAGALAGTSTSLQGTIVNNALVVFDQAFDGAFAGSMTGSGVLQKSGAGALTIDGSLAHTGGTIVTGGTLIGSASSLRGTILNDAAVTFAGNASGAFQGTLAGSGTFAKTGSGTLTLTGTHEHRGTFNVSEGTLDVDGLMASSFVVSPNATLRALGTLFGSANVSGSLAVPPPTTTLAAHRSAMNASGGDALNAPPLLTIGGDLSMGPGSTLFLPVGSGPTPTVLVGGRTTLNGATVNVTPLEPLTQRSTSFLGLASLNGLSMNNVSGTSANPLLVPYLKQDGNLLFVTLLNLGVPLSTSVTNPNASSVGGAIDRIKQGATGDQAIVIRELTSLKDGELDDALRQISGEAHASLVHFGIRDSELANDIVRRQIAARRREIRLGAKLGPSWWAQLGGERTRLSNANGDRVGTLDVGTGVGGMDYRPSERWIFGFGGGFAGGSMSLSDLTSSADVQAPRAFGYAGWRPKAFGIRGGGSFARQTSETVRKIVFVATLPDDLGGGAIGEGINRQAEAEEVTLVNDQWSEWDREHEIKTYTFEWLVGIRRATFTRRTFTEAGAESLSLLLPEQTLTLRQTNVVVHLWRREQNFRPFFELLYRRELTEGHTTTELQFPGEPDSRFFVDGLPAPKNITHARGGATWFTPYGTWTFEYQFRKATGQTTHSGDIRVRF